MLWSKLLKGGGYIVEYGKVYKGDARSLDYSSYRGCSATCT